MEGMKVVTNSLYCHSVLLILFNAKCILCNHLVANVHKPTVKFKVLKTYIFSFMIPYFIINSSGN